MSLSLYFLRHGETTHSQTGGYCGALDPGLTPAGLQMAQAFADAYRAVPWSAIFASPMQRTVTTAKSLCEAAGVDLQIREGLKEMHFGEWEDRMPDYVREHYPDDYVRWLTEPAWNPPTGGETGVQVASRASLAIAEIEDKFTTGNVLVVSHKTTIRILLCSLLGIDLGRYRDRIEMPVASVSLVKFDRHGPLLQRLGDRSHLPEELRNRAGT
ncbi:histidine phosphatase family protein [Synechococcus sp. PCC 7336]|uniref:histidine phosphatase family protein n=1 Tax=Synechococcus sp. PCC 7336 TaxID=195250 RepID=UPI00034AEBB6|nr:histidine phosphatase family protein [Synechococcus sp. PCC 7336]